MARPRRRCGCRRCGGWRTGSRVQLLSNPAQRESLRRLPQPLSRYSSEEAGIVDGAVFALSQGTDPEALLVIEAAEKDTGPDAWRHTLARMSSQSMRFYLDEQEVWSVEGYWRNPRSKTDAYVEAYVEDYTANPDAEPLRGEN